MFQSIGNQHWLQRTASSPGYKMTATSGLASHLAPDPAIPHNIPCSSETSSAFPVSSRWPTPPWLHTCCVLPDFVPWATYCLCPHGAPCSQPHQLLDTFPISPPSTTVYAEKGICLLSFHFLLFTSLKYHLFSFPTATDIYRVLLPW